MRQEVRYGHRFCIRIQKRITCFTLRCHCRGDNLIKAGIHFTDDLLDQASFSGSRPSFDQDQDRKLSGTDFLLLCNKPCAKIFDLRTDRFLVIGFAGFEIDEHGIPSCLTAARSQTTTRLRPDFFPR